MNIDIHTLAVLLSFMSLVQVIALYVQFRVNKSYQGPGWWVLGGATWALGFATNYLRDQPAFGTLAIVVNNALFAGGLALIYVGVQRFFHRRERRGWLIAFCTATTLIAAYFTFVDSDLAARRVNFSFAQAGVSLLIFQALIANRTRSIAASVNFLASVFLVNGLFFLARGLMPLFGTLNESLFTASLTQTATYLVALLISTLWTLGFVILVNQRLSAEANETRDNLEMFFNTSPDAVVISRLDSGRIANINDGFTRLTGYTREEVVGKSTLQVNIWHNPDDRQQIVSALQRQGVCENIEIVFQRKDGTVFTGMVSAKLISLQGALHTISFTRDISSRKQVDAALRASEEKFKAMADLLPQIIFETNARGELSYVNHQAFRVFGYAEDDPIIGQPSLSFHIPDERGRVIESIQCRLTGKAVENNEYTMLRRDGSTFPALVDSNPIVQDGRPVGLRGLIVDITERKRVEAVLHATQNRITQLLQTTDQGIYGIDLDGCCTFINQSGLKMLGYRLEECMAQNMHDLIHHSHSDGSRYAVEGCPIFRAKSTGMGYRIQNEVLWREDGSSFPAEYSSYPIVENGTIRGAVVTFSDITERRKVEQALALAKERAEAATQAKSEFLANMSHEIRTPINGVLGMTGLLLGTCLDEEQRHYAEIVASSAESLLAVINDILDFSKIEAGKLDLESMDIDLEHLLDDFVAPLALRAQQSGLELLYSADLDVPMDLRGDPGRLRQILTNLAGNAVKFTRAGEVEIRVAVDLQTSSEAVLRFTVRDTGIGIPQEKLGLLFNKFSQVDASMRRQFGGTGLGLAISKQLVEMMGGAIGVLSAEGEGTTFWFTVCMDKQSAVPPPQVQPPAGLEGVRILVVDDNATNRVRLRERLAILGMRPAEAPDAQAALQAMQQAADSADPFVVAMVDIDLSGTDGNTLGRMIKADSRLAPTVLVAMISLMNVNAAHRLQADGFAAQLTKPIRRQNLCDVLATVLVGAPCAAARQSGPGEQQLPHPASLADHAARFTGWNGRILVVEDNLTNQKVALGILRKLGLRADAVANGAEALHALESLPYDLVLMDVQMPIMDGLEATRHIRNLPPINPNRTVSIIAMTAEAMRGDQEKCLAAGMDDYISKPVTPQSLAVRLHQWLGGHTTERHPRN